MRFCQAQVLVYSLLQDEVFGSLTGELRDFEIKHSKEPFPAQYRHINDEEKISLTEAQFGKVVRKCVLYRGESEMPENGVEYKNVEEFLKGLV